MIIYWSLLAFSGIFALTERSQSNATPITPALAVFFILVVLVSGMRFEVGGDWGGYNNIMEHARVTAFMDLLKVSDPGYAFLNYVSTRLGLGIWFVNTVCALLFTFGLIRFSQTLQRMWLGLLVATPYLIIVVSMGYTRQGVAIGLALAGIAALRQGMIYRFLFWVFVAALFHKSAVVLFPMAALAVSRQQKFTILWCAVIALFAFSLLLFSHVNYLIEHYVVSRWNSEGAAIRTAMNLVPAVIFLALRTRFELSDTEKRLWTLMAWMAIVCVPILILTPSTTALDRLALYLIPLQLFVFSQLPNALGTYRSLHSVTAIAVVAYSIAIQFVWLNFASHADHWNPYQFYPFVYLS